LRETEIELAQMGLDRAGCAGFGLSIWASFLDFRQMARDGVQIIADCGLLPSALRLRLEENADSTPCKTATAQPSKSCGIGPWAIVKRML
jgi:hypothetical protein